MNTWLLTWTTYGTWLPGDPRGSVTRVREGAPPGGPRVEHDMPGTPYVGSIPGLYESAKARMRGPAVWLTKPQATEALSDLRSTSAYRGWRLSAAAVMANHTHVVVTAPAETTAAKLMQIYKSYASRRLNQAFGKPASGTWWTRSGSKRLLPDDRAARSAIAYVKNQHKPLAMYIEDNDA